MRLRYTQHVLLVGAHKPLQCMEERHLQSHMMLELARRRVDTHAVFLSCMIVRSLHLQTAGLQSKIAHMPCRKVPLACIAMPLLLCGTPIIREANACMGDALA